jgi:hypothetical protein
MLCILLPAGSNPTPTNPTKCARSRKGAGVSCCAPSSATVKVGMGYLVAPPTKYPRRSHVSSSSSLEGRKNNGTVYFFTQSCHFFLKHKRKWANVSSPQVKANVRRSSDAGAPMLASPVRDCCTARGHACCGSGDRHREVPCAGSACARCGLAVTNDTCQSELLPVTCYLLSTRRFHAGVLSGRNQVTKVKTIRKDFRQDGEGV